MPVKVLIYEDNQGLLSSIKTLFQWHDEFEVVAGMPNALSVITDIEMFKPDVILMDIDMPPDNGVEAVKKLRQRFTDIPVIMLTVFEDNDNIVNSICAGANGYLLKKTPPAKLFDAIQEVLEGGAPMSPTIARKVLNSFQTSKEANKYQLSPREIEVLQWLAKGYSIKLIAVEMFLAFDTVRSHLKNIYQKLHVNCGKEAIAKALSERIV